MKKTFVFLFACCLFLSQGLWAQRFQSTTGSAPNEDQWAVVQDAAVGGYVAIGNKPANGVNEVWISSYGPGGNVLTSARATNGRNMIARDISLAPPDPVTGNPTYYITGWTEILTPGVGLVNQMFTGRIDLNGFFLWYQENPIGGNGNPKEGVAVVTDNNRPGATFDAIVVGIVQWPGPGPVGFMVTLTRFNPFGAIVWSNVYAAAGSWMPREIDLGAPAPGCLPATPENFIITGEVAFPPGLVPQTFAAVYNGAGVECWRNTYPAAAAIATVGDAGYDVLFNPVAGNYCVVGVAQTGPLRGAATSTPYILNINPAGVMLAGSVNTAPGGFPLGLYPRSVSPGANPGQMIMAGPDFAANRTFIGMQPVLAAPLPAGVFFNYAGNATANSLGQPFFLNDAPPEDVLFTNLSAVPGYLASTNALPGPFGLGDAHYIRTDLPMRTPDSCMQNRVFAMANPTANNIPHPHVPIPLQAWGMAPTRNNADTVQQQFCRDTCIVNTSFSFTLSNDTAYFNNSSTGNGTLTYLWTFGDGTTDTSRNPVHYYSTPGTYVVCLTVVNTTSAGLSCTGVVCDTITISSCTVQAAFKDSLSCKTVYFTNQSTGTPGPLTYNWDFGDGTTSSATNPTKTYTVCGTYTVRLITCNATCCDTIVKQVNIPCCSVNADFCVSTNGRVATLNITSGTQPGTTYTVFVNGTQVTWASGTNRTLVAGINTICVRARKIVCGDTCCVTTCKTISVSDACTVTADFWHQVQTNGSVVFTNKSAPLTGNTYSWDFGVPGLTTDTSTATNITYT
ncbi:MAG: PKD domain-containing protein, partial [Dinghuibacter sp.]|nr:PKD domain-containing protein [Dinghuibacter sp.]